MADTSKTGAPDVIVVGAGPVGAYLAGRLGAAGLDVLVLERSARGQVRAEAGLATVDRGAWAELEIERPAPGAPPLVWEHEVLHRAPLRKGAARTVPVPADVLDLSALSELLAARAEATGRVHFAFETPFEEVTIRGSHVVGVRAKGTQRAARLVVDCSGRRAEVREALPIETGVDLLRERPLRRYTVYTERWRCTGAFPEGSTDFVAFQGFARQIGPYALLVGASSLGGPESALDGLNRLIEVHLGGVAHRTEAVHAAEVPYDFPPADLVGDGFLSVGDAAFQNEPLGGAGLASGMRAAKIAAPHVVAALRDGEAERGRLWGYPLEWFRGSGAAFAEQRGGAEALLDLEPADFELVFRASPDARPVAGLAGALRMLRLIPSNPGLFARVVHGLRAGARLAAHCRAYPGRPGDLGAWARRYEKLVRQAA